MISAITVARYLVEHALFTFATMGADPRIEGADRVLRWVISSDLARFSRRSAHRANSAYFARSTDLDPALALLVEHGYISPAHQDARPGRPSIEFVVNPAVWGPNNPNLARAPLARGSVSSVGLPPSSGGLASRPVQVGVA